MAGPRRWTVLETEFLQDCAVFSVSRTLSRSPRTGDAHSFYRIDSPDWVNIIPVTSAGDVVMVEQFRHGLDGMTIEIPGGLVDPGETPMEAAGRELLEETGYRAAEIVPLGGANPNPALFGNTLHVFLGRDVEQVAEVRNETTEETEVVVVSPAELRRLVRGGAVDHALVIAAFYLLDLEGDGEARA
jgi:8-oxo-dGTP pyrophosphatase MutT (NUDIX family)